MIETQTDNDTFMDEYFMIRDVTDITDLSEESEKFQIAMLLTRF